MRDLMTMFHLNMPKPYCWGSELQSDQPGREYWSACTNQQDFRNDAEFVIAIGRASERMGVKHTTLKPQLVDIGRHIAVN